MAFIALARILQEYPVGEQILTDRKFTPGQRGGWASAVGYINISDNSYSFSVSLKCIFLPWILGLNVCLI